MHLDYFFSRIIHLIAVPESAQNFLLLLACAVLGDGIIVGNSVQLNGNLPFKSILQRVPNQVHEDLYDSSLV